MLSWQTNYNVHAADMFHISPSLLISQRRTAKHKQLNCNKYIVQQLKSRFVFIIFGKIHSFVALCLHYLTEGSI